jgi:hypothetical protein
MRSLFENKRLIVLLAILALGALTVLAISLNGVPFRQAERFGRQKPESIEMPAAPPPQSELNSPGWKQLAVLGLLMLPVALVMMVLSPKWRKRLLSWLVWVVGIYYLLTNERVSSILQVLLGLGQQAAKSAETASDPSAPVPVFEPPEVSSPFSYLVSFAIALLLLVVMWGLYRGWQRYLLLSTPKPLEEIARIARSSLDDLSSGRNSSDVIINCYLRMSDVVLSKRQLRREIAMTPREFAARLEQAGLPGEAVRQLTRLFENVRYGDRKSGSQDVNEAVSCLKKILHYCGEPV